MAIEAMYQQASGPAFNDCFFLGQRFDDEVGYQPEESECWVLAVVRDGGAPRVSFQYGTQRWFTGLWRSPRAVAYVTDGTGEVHVNPALTAPDSHQRWTRHRLGVPLFGVWGIDDGCVFAWGGTFDGRNVMYRWDGQRWAEMPNPGFEVNAMHGTGPNLVYAVGRLGRSARWDGRTWQQLAGPSNEHLTSVFVASADEQYATGSAGSLLEGSAHGWARIARGPGPDTALFAVAKWHGEVWVGGGAFGLLRRKGTTDQLEVVKPNIRATGFDARENLVITCFDVIAGTADGAAFKGIAQNALLNARAGKDLLDFT